MKLLRVQPHPLVKRMEGPPCANCGAPTLPAIVPCPDPPQEIEPGVFKVCTLNHLGWMCICCDTEYVEDNPRQDGRRCEHAPASGTAEKGATASYLIRIQAEVLRDDGPVLMYESSAGFFDIPIIACTPEDAQKLLVEGLARLCKGGGAR